MRTGTIYALCEPDTGAIRYVGKTLQSVRARRSGHVREATQRGRSHAVCRWIRALVDRGSGPAAWVLEEDVPTQDLSEREAAWIAACRRWGDDLLNECRGRNGGCALPDSLKSALSSHARQRPRCEKGRFAA